MTDPTRCPWAAGDDALMTAYHDDEWGVPRHDDPTLFEFLTLEGAQAGLSWRTVLGKRGGYRAAFAGFDAATVAGFDDGDVERLLGDPGIIRHRGKVASTVANAHLVAELGSGGFGALLWSFVDGVPVQGHRKAMADVPATTPVSDRMSKELRRRGFRFVGSTTCYSLMQACGLVNDHLVSCHRYQALR